MRVVITRSAHQAASFSEALLNIGAQPIFFPTISIQSPQDSTVMDATLDKLGEFDWIIFTSSNAVAAVSDGLKRSGAAYPSKLKTAAVGPKTANRLKAIGITPHFVPKKYIAEAIIPGLGDLSGKRVFLPLGDLATHEFSDAITNAGGTPVRVTAYHTLPATPDPNGLKELQMGVDVITFTSGSTAQNFSRLVAKGGLDPFDLPGKPLIICIGPKTSTEARQAGFQVDMVAKEHTIEGLLSVLKTVQKSGYQEK